ncbi:uncharacterized protein BJ171DRAFT_513438 [Polychytrium aggregatum]|uniref:uncharacterized protein n=1 Tax=Polychytrium aggregatum TaxID=110093 RepID=UPI0022FEDFBC|nr:uncharacterized protein BJ171DRAFT_513438 [Polychytrium aggregatum]KAI9202565.1 hypothetical protein BJ171DRAFT_513438 [Polychytrium aggregatum]
MSASNVDSPSVPSSDGQAQPVPSLDADAVSRGLPQEPAKETPREVADAQEASREPASEDHADGKGVIASVFQIVSDAQTAVSQTFKDAMPAFSPEIKEEGDATDAAGKSNAEHTVEVLTTQDVILGAFTGSVGNKPVTIMVAEETVEVTEDVTEHVDDFMKRPGMTIHQAQEALELAVLGKISHKTSETGNWDMPLCDCFLAHVKCLGSYIFPCYIDEKHRKLRGWETISCAGTSIWFYCCQAPCLAIKLRSQMRKLFGIKGHPFTDCLTHTFCCCCALAQERRQLEVMGLLTTNVGLQNVDNVVHAVSAISETVVAIPEEVMELGGAKKQN